MIDGYTEEQQQEEEYLEKYEAANGLKFIPGVVVADLLKQGTVANLVELSNVLEGRKIEEMMGLSLSDYDYENEDSSIIDIAVTINIKTKLGWIEGEVCECIRNDSV